jgi:hypothetical protein
MRTQVIVGVQDINRAKDVQRIIKNNGQIPENMINMEKIRASGAILPLSLPYEPKINQR